MRETETERKTCRENREGGKWPKTDRNTDRQRETERCKENREGGKERQTGAGGGGWGAVRQQSHRLGAEKGRGNGNSLTRFGECGRETYQN